MSAVQRPLSDSPVSFKRPPKNEAARSSTPYRIYSSRKATKLPLKPTPTRLNDSDAANRLRFLEGRGTHLQEKQGHKFQPLARNEKAEERVREMLLADQPTVGLSKPEKWGLARALWCPQEHLVIDGFDGLVLSRIQELLGKQALDV